MKSVYSIIVALVALTATSTFATDLGLQSATDFSEVGQGKGTVVAKFRVSTTSSRVLTDSWQVGLRVSNGDASTLGTVYWTSASGGTVAYSEVFTHMGDQRTRMTILTPDQNNWGEPNFQSYPLQDGQLLEIAVDTGAFPDGTQVSVTSVSLVGIDMAVPNPHGEVVWHEVPGGVTSTVTVRAPRAERVQIAPTPVVVSVPVISETLFTSSVIHRQDVTFFSKNPGLFVIFGDMIPAGATIKYLNVQLHWVTPVLQIIQDSAFLIEGEGEIVDYKVVLPQ